MRNGKKSIALLAILWLAGFVGTPVMAADIDALKNTGALDRLFTYAALTLGGTRRFVTPSRGIDAIGFDFPYSGDSGSAAVGR